MADDSNILYPALGAALIGALAGALLPVILTFASGPKHEDPRWKRERARERQAASASWASSDSFGSAALRGLVGAALAGGAAFGYLKSPYAPQRDS
tara:strand:- start:1179 stop:1466 length:288 start_codon:yes stop_codon:yes gene_type:complete